MLLILLLGFPLIGAIAVIFSRDGSTAKQLSLLTSLINLVGSLVLWGELDSNSNYYQFVQGWNSAGLCNLHIGVDAISIFFLILTCFLIPSCLIASWRGILGRPGVKSFLIALLVLETLLIALFVVIDLLLFYICFESVLIPLSLLIGLWSHSSQKIRATFLLFLYTLFGSLFMLLSIITIYVSTGTTDLQLLSTIGLDPSAQHLLWLGFFIAFAIKTPLFPAHIWLPIAHTEAPLAGSILLAGIILKLPVYGCLRILLPLLPEATQYFTPLVYTLCLLSIFYTSLSTLRQISLKSIIAYSSISHMAIATMGIFSNSIPGIEGGLFFSLAHGIVSPALFVCVGVLYDRTHTLILRYYRGLATMMPLFSILFFVFILSNMGVPLTGSFIGEFLSFLGIFQRNPVLAALAPLASIVLTAAYSIWLYNRVCLGTFSPYLLRYADLTRREFYLLLPFLLLSLILGLFPNLVLATLHLPVSAILYQISPLEDCTYFSLSALLASSRVFGTLT
jgi:NADH-ubiquinone oxidoreductase chain 4